MSGRFNGSVALVTGGGTGIGRASAILFAQEGAKVVVADVNEATGNQTCADINNGGGEATFVNADVAKAAEVEHLIRETMRIYGQLDCAHNNAGIGGSRVRCHEYSEEEWDRVVHVNLKGVWLCLKYEIPEMLKAGRGAIVNTASIGGIVGIKRSAPYVVAKHGIVGLTTTAALEYVRDGLRINCVCPGMIDTPLFEEAIVGTKGTNPIQNLWNSAKKAIVYKSLEGQQPSGRMGTAEEIAQAVLWLCSSEASFISGHAMVIDGAYTAR